MATNSQQLFLLARPHAQGLSQQSDVALSRFIADNFQKCDTNGDGRLTQAEVSACMAPAR
jgi:hypothetical protein